MTVTVDNINERPRCVFHSTQDVAVSPAAGVDLRKSRPRAWWWTSTACHVYNQSDVLTLIDPVPLSELAPENQTAGVLRCTDEDGDDVTISLAATGSSDSMFRPDAVWQLVAHVCSPVVLR